MTDQFLFLKRRSLIAGVLGGLAALVAPGYSAHAENVDLSGVKLVVGSVDGSRKLLYEASGVLKDIPFTVEWAQFPQASQVLNALHTDAIDLGLGGDTGLVTASGNSTAAWTQENAPIKIAAIWGPANTEYAQFVTVASLKGGVKDTSPESLRGKTWGYVPGGNIHLQFLLSLKAAGLKPADVKAVQFQDNTASRQALSEGLVDIVSGNVATTQPAIQAGAPVLFAADDVGVPGFSVWQARSAVINDPRKSAALEIFVRKTAEFYDWWGSNRQAVEKLLVEKLNYNPAVAKVNAISGEQVVVPIDERLYAFQQPISDLLSENGIIKNPVDVRTIYTEKYNEAVGTPRVLPSIYGKQ